MKWFYWLIVLYLMIALYGAVRSQSHWSAVSIITQLLIWTYMYRAHKQEKKISKEGNDI
jgi:hypothetical protein